MTAVRRRERPAPPPVPIVRLETAGRYVACIQLLTAGGTMYWPVETEVDERQLHLGLWRQLFGPVQVTYLTEREIAAVPEPEPEPEPLPVAA
jgi:hypothetical protein